MVTVTPFYALAETNSSVTSNVARAVENVTNSLQVNYALNGDTVIETTTFTDVDDKPVDMWRSIEKDGTGKLIYSKSGESTTTVLSNQDYDVFVSLVYAIPAQQTRGANIGKDLVGAQYKHIYIASNSATIGNSAISQIATGGVGLATSIIIGSINVPAGIAASAAAFIYSSILTSSPAKVVINNTVSEVHFSADNIYYTHCYHENIKSYDTGNHLVDTTIMYKQAVGG